MSSLLKASGPGGRTRRRFLQFLLASPLLADRLGAFSALAQASEADLIAADQALCVLDFEAGARKRLPPAHFGYLATGVDDDATLRANRDAFARLRLRVRRLIDVREIDTSVSLFGTSLDSPIVLAPVSSQRAFHPEGEIAVAKAARSRKHLQVLSTVSSTSVEDVTAARGESVWYQLYPTNQWSVAQALVKRAAAAGCPVLVLTTDLQGGTNRETLTRSRRIDPRDCTACHQSDPLRTVDGLRRKPMFAGLDLAGVTQITLSRWTGITWADRETSGGASSC